MPSDRNASAGAAAPLPAPFRIGEWLVEPAWNRIRKDRQQAVKLEPRVMRLLATLAAAPGQPIGREQLLEAIWPNVLVNEEALSRAVSQLRRALGDDRREPRYIQTVHKGGYSLVAPIRDAAAEPEPAGAVPTPGRRVDRRLVAGLLFLCLGLAAAFLYKGSRPSAAPPEVLRLTPLTSAPGREIDPAISSDGRRVVYAASTGDGFDLFMQNLDGGTPVRLTRSPLVEAHPVWSPGGERIAYVGAAGDAAAIYLLSVKDRTTTKLTDLPSWSYGLDWSPDGRTIAYSEAASGEAAAIVLLDIATRSARALADGTSPASDVKPVFSPDGRRLAFIRDAPLDRQQIFVVALEGDGAPRALGLVPRQIRGLDWSPGGRSLIFSARSGRKFGLWRVPADGSAAPQALPTEGGDLFNPSASATGRLVFEEVEQDRDIWQANLRTGAARAVIRSTSDDYDPAHSPDGLRVAFVSERSGSPEIWLQPAGGEEPARQVTRLGGPGPGSISWSPDGSSLAFAVEEDGFSAIHSVSVGGAGASRLLGGRRNRVPVGWSAAGRELIILSSAARDWQLERLNTATASAGPLLDRPVKAAAMARDGRSVFAVPSEGNRLLRIVPGDGFVQQFRLPAAIDGAVTIHPAENLLYLVEGSLGTARIHRLDLRNGSFASPMPIEDFWGGASSLSPDGASLLYTRARETGNDLAWLTLGAGS